MKQIEVRDNDGHLVRKTTDWASLKMHVVDYGKINWNSPDKRDNRDPEDLGIQILDVATEGAYSLREAADRVL